MSAIKEKWNYGGDERVWVGTYMNSQNALHWHGDCELIYCERGKIDVAVSGCVYTLAEKNAMFIGSELMHRINARTSDALLKTIVFDSELIRPFASDMCLRSPMFERSYDVPAVYAALMAELTEKKPLYAQAAENTVQKLMIDVFRNETTEPAKQRSKTDARLKSLFAEIRENFASYTLSDAASFMGMNDSYLSRFFTAKTGMHFMRYLNGVRVEKAVEMLKSGENNVTETAAACGFDTIRNFNRIFKLLTGYAPTALPDTYEFPAFAVEQNDAIKSPTLGGCVLVESSTKNTPRINP